MAELAEWSAQALRCQGSDVPVKVVYIRSRVEAETSDSFYQYRNYGLPEESPKLGKQISHHASGASDLQAFVSGQFFKPVEVLDSKNFILQGEEFFEDRKSALEDLASKFKSISRVVPFDPEASYGPKYSYVKPEFIEPSEKEDLLWYYLLNYATNAKEIEKKEKEKEDEEKRREEDKKRREEILKRREEVRGMNPPTVRSSILCALISGIITEFNPSGMWIVEEFFNDEEEVK